MLRRVCYLASNRRWQSSVEIGICPITLFKIWQPLFLDTQSLVREDRLNYPDHQLFYSLHDSRRLDRSFAR